MSADQNHWTDWAKPPKPQSEWTVEDWVDFYQRYEPTEADLRAAGLLQPSTEEEAEIRRRILEAYQEATGER